MSLPIPLQSKISVRDAIMRGVLFVNLPVLILVIALPAIWLWLAIVKILPTWVPIVSFPFSFLLAWLWWSFSIPKWRFWAMRRVDNLYKLHIQAVRAQLVWPRGSLYENTEIKSSADVLREKHVEIHHYFDKFRYYLDYLETKRKSFVGLEKTRDAVDVFRDALYFDDKNMLDKANLKISIDQLRLILKSVRNANNDTTWPALVDELQKMLDGYQGLVKQSA